MNSTVPTRSRGWRGGDEPQAACPPREFTTPFSQAILETAIPSTFTGPKVTFTGVEDPEAHLTAFHTQMLLVGGRKVQAFHEHVDGNGYGLVHQPFQRATSRISPSSRDCSENSI